MERVCWLGIPSPEVAHLAGRAGFSACVVDREHGQIGTETATLMLHALAATGTPGLVRIPELSEGAVKHALDAGAAGIVVPYIETEAEARRAARAFHFPPLGARGYAPPVVRAFDYGRAPAPTEPGLLALQIESRAGIENAGAIAGVEGVGMLFFGPYDYALEAGLDPATDGAALADAFGAIRDAARGAGIRVGTFPWPGSDPEAEGADMAATGSDIMLLSRALEQAAKPAPG